MDDGMGVHPQAHMGHHGPPAAHAPSLMQTMSAMNGHHHMGHTPDHDMARKYGLHTKLEDHQASMTLNLVKSEGLPSHYLYGPLDHPVSTV